MKRIFNKILLSVLLTTSFQIMDADLSLTTKSIAHSALKKVGNNPGWLAFSLMLPLLYVQYDQADPETEAELRMKTIVINSSVVAFGALALSAACNWWASKL